MTALPVFAEFDLEDFTLPEAGVHFTFNGDAKDEGGALTGELVGDPAFVEGRDGTANGAIYLDSSEQYVFLGKNVDAANYTASFWLKVKENTEHVFLCSSMIGSIRILQDIDFVVGNTVNGIVDNFSVYTAPRDTWVMMTFVYTGSAETMDVYAYGEYVDTLEGALPLPFTLLGNDAHEQKGWQTVPYLTIDDAWFFPRAFTADEVAAMYNETNVGGDPAPVPGDVNGDDKLDSNDAIYLLRHTMNPDCYPINQSGDMNNDGKMDSNDAIYLLRHTMNPERYPLK